MLIIIWSLLWQHKCPASYHLTQRIRWYVEQNLPEWLWIVTATLTSPCTPISSSIATPSARSEQARKLQLCLLQMSNKLGLHREQMYQHHKRRHLQEAENHPEAPRCERECRGGIQTPPCLECTLLPGLTATPSSRHCCSPIPRTVIMQQTAKLSPTTALSTQKDLKEYKRHQFMFSHVHRPTVGKTPVEL